MAPDIKPDDLPMVDAHVHFWDPTKHYYPWLNDEPMIPFRYGDYSAIRRPYYPAEHLADARRHGHNIVKTVYLEAEWDPKDPIGEMEFIAELRKETGSPDVAVAQAWLDRDDVARVLERHARIPFVRGVRQKPRANASPRDGRPGSMMDPLWREGFARLKPLGLRFDLQTPWWHLHEAVDLAGAFPDTQIILLHSGLPADRSREGIEAWKKQMAGLAQAPNVAAKISGIGVPGAALDRRAQPRDRAHHHRSLRPGALHVRQQFPGRQRLRQPRCDLRRLQDHHRRLLRRGAQEDVP